MQIVNYLIEAYITFDNDSIENYLTVCEGMINNITEDEEIIFKLKSAAHELVVNSLEHGYNKDTGKVSFLLQKEDNIILLEIKDEGKGISESALNFDSEPVSLDLIKSRGWGLLILNRLFESMEFTKNSPKGTKVNLTLIE